MRCEWARQSDWTRQSWLPCCCSPPLAAAALARRRHRLDSTTHSCTTRKRRKRTLRGATVDSHTAEHSTHTERQARTSARRIGEPTDAACLYCVIPIPPLTLTCSS